MYILKERNNRTIHTLVLTYAEVDFTAIYDEEVLSDQLLLYDWLHLHHEDFTGQ
jgi:hypothetical protein